MYESRIRVAHCVCREFDPFEKAFVFSALLGRS